MLARFFKLFCALFIITILAAPGAAQAATASGNVTTNHWKKGAAEGYSLTATVTVPSAQADLALMTLSGPQIVSPVSLTADTAGTTYTGTVLLSTRPSEVGDAYTVQVSYLDDPPTAPDTLILPVRAVVDSFATLTAPLGGVAGTTNPTFTWQPAQLTGLSGYRLSISGLDETPWLSAQLSAGTLSAQYQATGSYPSSLTKGNLYDWSVYTFDSLGNSSENRDGTVMIGANISGTVTDLSGAPVAGATVAVYNTLNAIVTATETRADGSYLVGGLNTTDYRLRFSKDGKAVFYNNRLDASDNLAVSAIELKTGINAVLGGWGVISGKVVNSSAAGLSGYRVELLDANGQATTYPAVTTQTGGAFTFSLVAPGTYRIRVVGANGYASLDYGSTLSVSEGQITQIPSDAVLYKVNITGTVRDLAGAPVPGVWVYLYTSANNLIMTFSGVQTSSDGTYAFSGVGTGNYKVLFDSNGYAVQYYNRKATVEAADIITVNSTTVTTGIDAVLGSGRPTITGFTVPATSSSLTVSGITLTAAESTYGVAGYLITESPSAPSATASGWTTSAPTSYTFTEVGEKTLYAWAKGATGLVSASSVASVSVDAGAVTPGDSDGDGVITIAEVKLALDMYLKLQAPARFVDADGDDVVTLLEVQKVINAFLAVQ